MTAAPLGAERLVGGRYVLEAPVGRGGMGEVWRARHVTLASPVAIKFLHAASAESESSRRRFLTEARVTANLRSRHAVSVFDFGVTEDGLPYLVMELLEGETLDRRIAREGRLPVSATTAILETAARALTRAHGLGIVHRDFKPENIMLVPDDEDGGHTVKVLDFGIAKLVGGLDEERRGGLAALAAVFSPRAEGGAPPPSSITSAAVGTPFYMAPEQVLGARDVGPAADVWAFGVVAYECLTGRRPFAGENVNDLLLRVTMARPAQLASACAPVPPAFDAWFGEACARRPGDRFSDVQSAATALALVLGSPTPSSSPSALLPSSTGRGLELGAASPMARSIAPPVEAPSSARNLPSGAAGSSAHAVPDSAPGSPRSLVRARATLATRSFAAVLTAAAVAGAALAIVARDAPDPPRLADVARGGQAPPSILPVTTASPPSLAQPSPDPAPPAAASAAPGTRSTPRARATLPRTSAYQLPALGL